MSSPLATAFGNEMSQGCALRSISQRIKYTDFTDGGSTAGTLNLKTKLPKGAIALGVKVEVNTAFTGDTSAVLIAGNSSDTNAYSFNTNNVYTTGMKGSQADFTASAYVFQTAESNILITVTSGADFTSVSAGDAYVTIYYISTVEDGGNAAVLV